MQQRDCERKELSGRADRIVSYKQCLYFGKTKGKKGGKTGIREGGMVEGMIGKKRDIYSALKC